MTTRKFAYHLPGDQFRSTAAGEKDWQEMMHNRTPLARERFLQVSYPGKMRDEGEGPVPLMDNPDCGIFQTTIRGHLVLFVQKNGAEFIYTPAGAELPEMRTKYPVSTIRINDPEAFMRRPNPVLADVQQIPPVPCDFRVGDRVTVTNGYGVEIPGKLITGFDRDVNPGGRTNAFIYLDWDCYWFSVKPEDLQLERRAALAPEMSAEESPSPSL